ncbi:MULTISPECIES: hypothetical protein [Haloferacaceae]|uniref:DUF8128 domain-containing protein n=1 Tax=Halorubrum glutamatedens TaxID=2707018 RepID=A0ABD5QMJ3_9EURY|nr:hypothetical protein [Halobellus captivus]
MIRDRLFTSAVELDEDQARYLRAGSGGQAVEVHPPRAQSISATLNQFTKTIYEPQTKWFGVKNTSPVAAFEIRRTVPDQVSMQFIVPTKRLERKVRTQLENEVPGVGFSDGTLQLPISEGCTVGGGLLEPGCRDWYPLETGFNSPPNNSVLSALHRHAMQNSQFVIQILFQPVVGRPVRSWWWTRRAYQRIGYLRKEKEKLWGSRSATPREKQQANAVEAKAGSPRFNVSIRFLIVNGGEYTRSRVKELSGAFNVFENPETGQYLNATTVQTLRKRSLLRFVDAVGQRDFQGWGRRFQATTEELASLISIPDIDQQNIQYNTA